MPESADSGGDGSATRFFARAWAYDKAVQARAWRYFRRSQTFKAMGVASAFVVVGFPIHWGWRGRLPALAELEIWFIYIVLAGIVLGLAVYFVSLCRAASDLHAETLAERDGALHDLQKHRRAPTPTDRLETLHQRGHELYKQIPGDGELLLREWKPRYEQWKTDALESMPTLGYRARFNENIKACEEDVRLTQWDTDDWRATVTCIRKAIQDILDEL